MPTTITAIALAALGQIFLTLRIIKRRYKYQAPYGDAGQDDLNRAIRAHGNYTEIMPFFLALLAAAEYLEANTMLLIITTASMFIGRLCHYLSTRPAEPNLKVRAAGMTLGYFFPFVVLAGVLLFSVLF